ncbi:N-acetylmuramoyl-L-alanine amidase [Spirochaetia bacterium]|nr:N-acetylmuramoyl-L-alanine amidase [Spirochaetia bacterium]
MKITAGNKKYFVFFLLTAINIFFISLLYAEEINPGGTPALTKSNAVATKKNAPTPVQQKNFTLKDTLKKLDANFSWDPFFLTCVITSHTHNATFKVNTEGKNTIVLYDYDLLFNMRSPYLNEKGELLFPENFVIQLAGLFNESRVNDASRYHIAAIIVDPGHGGKDPGAIGEVNIAGKKVKMIEKDIALKVSKELFNKLKKTYPDKKLVMTRTGDTYPQLSERTEIANNVDLKENEAIIYVSVHANSSFNKKASGYEVLYLSPEIRRELIDKPKTGENGLSSVYNAMLEEQFTIESKLLSKMISSELGNSFSGLMKAHGEDIKPRDLYVVKKARMPSVLVELGFLTNANDAELMLNSPAKFADAIYAGITKFVSSFESSGGFTQAN